MFPDGEGAKIRIQRVVDKQTPDEWVADAEDEFQYFRGLNQADLSRDDPQDTYLASGRGELVPWRPGHDAA